MNPEDDDGFQFEGALDVGEANRILPRLEQEKIRFKIAADVSGHRTRATGRFRDARIKLFVHADDVSAWHALRDEYFPV